MYRILPIILPLLLIALGFGIYFYLTSESLTERQFTYKGKQFSILVPRTFQYKDTDDLALWGKGKKILAISLALAEKKATTTIICSDLKIYGSATYYSETETASTANIKLKSLKKSFEVCRTPDPNFPGYVVLDILGLEENNTRYLLAINVKEDFIKTKNGQEKVKEIIESFKIMP